MDGYEIRKAAFRDLDAIAALYERIHDAEEAGRQAIGWIRGVYPTRATAERALDRGDLYVLKADGDLLGAAVINQIQMEAYAQGCWRYPAGPEEVLVLHTLVIAPEAAGRGYGRAFAAFYETLARRMGCRALRMDTNEKNRAARALYRTLGYEEIGVVPTVFNGIPDVRLMLLEKGLV